MDHLHSALRQLCGVKFGTLHADHTVVLAGGDDYELLFTASPGAALPAGTLRIGKVMPAGETPLMLDSTAQHHGDRLGYMHG